MRTDPVSSASGGTDLRRMQLRWSHHISTLKIVHCRQPLSISGHYTRRKEEEQTTKRWKLSLLGFPEFLSEATSGRGQMRTCPQSGCQGLDETSPRTQAHQAGNPPQLQIRLLEPGGNHGATSKCSDFADEEAEAQTSKESCTRSRFWTKLYRTADSL